MISSAGTAALVQPTRRRSDRARAGLVISRELLSPQGRERLLTTPSEREFLKKVPPASPPSLTPQLQLVSPSCSSCAF